MLLLATRVLRASLVTIDALDRQALETELSEVAGKELVETHLVIVFGAELYESCMNVLIDAATHASRQSKM